MQLFAIFSLLLSISSYVSTSPLHKRTTNTTEKRYVIIDNDWNKVGFIPFLQALDAGIEVLAVTSCKSITNP